MSLKPTSGEDLKNPTTYKKSVERILASHAPGAVPYTYYSKLEFLDDKKSLPVVVFGAPSGKLKAEIDVIAKFTKPEIKTGKVSTTELGGKVQFQFDKNENKFYDVFKKHYNIPDAVFGAGPEIDYTQLKLSAAKGEGGFGKVVQLEDADGKPLPLVFKTPKAAVNDPKYKSQKEDIENEAATYARIQAMIGPHPNLAQCHGVRKIGGQEGLVMENITGGSVEDVFDRIQKLREKDKLSEPEYWGALQHIMKGTLQGLAALDECAIVHGDIKDTNVMFDPLTMQPKIVDFGLATEPGSEVGPRDVRFQPPEIASPDTKTSKKQDAYTAGQMLYERTQGGIFAYGLEMVGKDKTAQGDYVTPQEYMGSQADFGNNPRDVMQPERTANTVAHNKENLEKLKRNEKPAAFPSGMYNKTYKTDFISFMNQLMDPDPKVRLSPAQALMHPFLVNNLVDGGVVDSAALFQKILADPAPAAAVPQNAAPGPQLNAPAQGAVGTPAPSRQQTPSANPPARQPSAKQTAVSPQPKTSGASTPTPQSAPVSSLFGKKPDKK
jgi:serine/threonine protein kinase